MAPKKDRGPDDDNVIRFDFRDELKKQRGKQRRKEWILALGSRLVQSQNATAAARLTADRKFLASLS